MSATLTRPESKASKLRALMISGNEREALKLAASFPRLGDQKAVVTRAWAAIQNPDFYRQIGQDPEALYAAGIEAVRLTWCSEKPAAK